MYSTFPIKRGSRITPKSPSTFFHCVPWCNKQVDRPLLLDPEPKPSGAKSVAHSPPSSLPLHRRVRLHIIDIAQRRPKTVRLPPHTHTVPQTKTSPVLCDSTGDMDDRAMAGRHRRVWQTYRGNQGRQEIILLTAGCPAGSKTTQREKHLHKGTNMHRRTGRRNSVTAVPINPHYGGRLAPFQRCADEPSPQGTP